MIIVKTEIEEVQKALSGTKKSLANIQRMALRTIARGANKQIKATLKNKQSDEATGKLLRAQVYHVKRDGSEVNLYPRAYGRQNWAVGLTSILNYGNEHVGRGRNGVIKPMCFIEAGENYIEAGSYDGEIEKLVDKELKKYFG